MTSDKIEHGGLAEVCTVWVLFLVPYFISILHCIGLPVVSLNVSTMSLLLGA